MKMPKDIVHDYPLRPGQDAQLVLPADLTELEARRLGAFVLALAQPWSAESELRARCAALEAENAALREWLRGELTIADVEIDEVLARGKGAPERKEQDEPERP